MNRTQSENHKIGTYEIKKMSLSYFEDKIYIHKQWLVIRVRYKRTVT